MREAGNSSGMQRHCLVLRKSLLAAAEGPEVLLVCQERYGHECHGTREPYSHGIMTLRTLGSLPFLRAEKKPWTAAVPSLGTGQPLPAVPQPFLGAYLIQTSGIPPRGGKKRSASTARASSVRNKTQRHKLLIKVLVYY